MNRATAIRFLGLYGPVVTAFALGLARPRERRALPALLVGIAWTLPWLLVLQVLNLHFGWWRFYAQGGLFRGMPVDLFLGWAVLWGILPLLVLPGSPIWKVVVVFFGIDLLFMPVCWPVVELSRTWLLGELLALLLVLIPAQTFARWTLKDTHLAARSVFHVLMAGGTFLFLLPETIFALRPGLGWSGLFSQTVWVRNVELQCVATLGILGVSAVQEFAQRGGGTPIPYDPPQRLVVSGFYRYISNPMQLSCALVMTAWGLVLRNPWLTMAGPMSFFYSAGLAHWDEGEDMKVRFGESWLRYSDHVRAWQPRWRPRHDSERPLPRLYIAETCGPCSEVREWFEAQGATGLEIVAAEDHPTQDLQRMTYDAMDGCTPETGARAFARGLEHIHFGWAFAGAAMRLPGISHLIQLVLDASGMGPQRIPRRCSVKRKIDGKMSGKEVDLVS